jgi:hypothetical protein
VRHVFLGPRWVALARVSLWLLLTGDFCQKLCDGCRYRSGLYVVYFLFLVMGYIAVWFRVVVVVCLVVYVFEKSSSGRLVSLSCFLLRICKFGPVLQPKGGEYLILLSYRSYDP